MSLARYAAKLAALLNSGGQIGNSGISDLDASKLNAGALPIARLDLATLVTKAPVCYARGQIDTSASDTFLPIDPQYKQSIVYFRAYGIGNSDAAAYFNGYTSIYTGATYQGASVHEGSAEWNGWLLHRGAGTSPALVNENAANTRWMRWIPLCDYGQNIGGTVTVNQSLYGNRASILWDINYTKNGIGATRSMGSGHKTVIADPINGLQFDWDAGNGTVNPSIHIDYYIVGVK